MDDELVTLFEGDAQEAHVASTLLLPLDGQLVHAGNVTDTVLPATNDTQTHSYSDGEIIEQQWHGVFFFLAYVTACVGAYGAIRLLEHALWRSEKERENASSKFAMYLRVKGMH